MRMMEMAKETLCNKGYGVRRIATQMGWEIALCRYQKRVDEKKKAKHCIGRLSKRDVMMRYITGHYTFKPKLMQAARLKSLLAVAPLATWMTDAARKGANEMFWAKKIPKAGNLRSKTND